jgi:hypothetical protein
MLILQMRRQYQLSWLRTVTELAWMRIFWMGSMLLALRQPLMNMIQVFPFLD